MQTPRRAATAGLAVLVVTAVATAAALGVLTVAPAARAGAAAPNDQFRIVTEIGGCGDVDNEIWVAWFRDRPYQLRIDKPAGPGPVDQVRIALIRDGMEEVTRTIREMRTNGEHVDLMFTLEIGFDVVLGLLEAVRAAGVQCVVLGNQHWYQWCKEPDGMYRRCLWQRTG